LKGATKRVDHSQNGESSVVLIGDQSEFLAHSINGSIGDVDTVQESEEEQQAEDGNDPDINLLDQRRLVDVWIRLPGDDLSTSELGELPIGRGSWGTRSWWRGGV